MAAPRVSVIIPVEGEAPQLARTLASVARQSAPPAEIIIVTNLSRRSVAARPLLALKFHYRGIPLHLEWRKASRGGLLNHATLLASGELIALLDPQDWWLPKKLSRALGVLKKSKATFVAHDYFLAHAGTRKRTHIRTAAFSRAYDLLSGGHPRIKYFYQPYIAFSTVVLRREALLAAGGFDPTTTHTLLWEALHAVLATAKRAKFVLISEGLTVRAPIPETTRHPRKMLEEHEAMIRRHVHNVARFGNVPWPVLLFWAWDVQQTAVAQALLAQRQWRRLARVTLRVPIALIGLMARACLPARRPLFLGPHTPHP